MISIYPNYSMNNTRTEKKIYCLLNNCICAYREKEREREKKKKFHAYLQKYRNPIIAGIL